MKLYREALNSQAFNKEPNHLFGYMIKLVLASPEQSAVRQKPWTALKGLMSESEYREGLRSACKLWGYVSEIHKGACASEKVSTELSQQFT